MLNQIDYNRKVGIMMEFKGSEKQIKWANDIVDKAKKGLENRIKEAENYADSDALENCKNLCEIITNVLSNLHSVWTAGDVIENRTGLEQGKLETFGIKSFGGGMRIKVDGTSYRGSDLKDESIKKEVEEKVLNYIMSQKK